MHTTEALMKKHFTLVLSGIIVLAMAVVFAVFFSTYAQPLKNESHDLSLVYAITEIDSIDRSAELGWSVYTCEGDVVTPLTYDGLGCYDGLQYLGQTFYYSRVMTESIQSPSLSLDSINRNYSVFLDGTLIYTDCPEQDNRIGYLTLPSRDWERTENIIIPLPENYIGKTLTIAQSTPMYAETPRMATRVMPSSVTLYCSYAYESMLIAESFQTASVAAAYYAVGVLMLIFFVRRLMQGTPDVSLLLLALTVFLAMAVRMYETSYQMKYFGTPFMLSASTLAGWFAETSLFFFLAMKTHRTRTATWILSGVYTLLNVLHLMLTVFNNVSQHPLQILLFNIRDNAAFVLLLVFLVLFWFERKQDDFFHKLFTPLCTLGIVVYIAVQLLLPERGAFLQTFCLSVMNLSMKPFAWPLACLLLIAALILTLADFIRNEFHAKTEQHLMQEMADMSRQRYENLRRHNEEIMMLRHDMARHFRLLRQTTTDPRTAAYLDELIGRNERIRPVLQSGNDMLDIILCGRLSAAMDAGIQVKIVRSDAPAVLPASDADLCSLVMNLVDNAITAASAAATPYIRLDLHQKNGFFVFICENSMPGEAPVAKTEKTAPKHGLGLKIVRQIADRYGYLLTMGAESGSYKVSLAMQLNQPAR